MDGKRFDAVTRLLTATPSRRAALGALLGAGLGGALGRAGAKKNSRKRRRRQKQGRAALAAEAADCLNPGPSSNMNGCNFNNANFVGEDLSSSSMRGTRFRGANLCGADLSSSQLKDADFRGFAAGQGSGNPTTLFRADLSSSGCKGTLFNNRTHFCQTRTCNGAVNNRDCPDGVDPQDVCCGNGDCRNGRVCVEGVCTCDVCPDGCAFDSVAEAIANASAGATIVVCPGTYPLTANLVIDKNLTLIGAGNETDGTILDGQLRFHIDVAAGAAVTIRDLTLTRGRGFFGGGIHNSGTLTLVAFSGIANSSLDGARAILNEGTLTLIDGLLADNGCGRASSGALWNLGTARVMRTTVTRNCETGITNDGELTLEDGSSVSRGLAVGIDNGGNGTLTLRDSSVTDNDAGTGIINRNKAALEDGSRVTRNKRGIFNEGSLTISADSSASGNEEFDCEDVPPNGTGCPS